MTVFARKIRKPLRGDVLLAALLKDHGRGNHEDVSGYMPAHLANQNQAREVDKIIGNNTAKEMQPRYLPK